jgi:peptide/nickel transport system permease protein
MNSLVSVEALRPRWREFRLRFHLLNRNLLVRIALLVIAAEIVLAILAPYIAPYPESIAGIADPALKLRPPSMTFFFGTDELGRDLFSRVLYGTRISLGAGTVTVALALLIGVPLGAIAGYKAGFFDDLIMRITDVFLSFPSRLMAIVIAAFLGPSLRNAILACAISWWPWYTRIIRGSAISIRERQFVRASRAIGAPGRRIVLGHILPNCIGPIIVQASLDFGSVVLILSALSFLGLGAQAPTPEWGLMINTSRNYFMSAWWYIIFPGLGIVITVLAFNLLGDGLREVLDPRTRKY